MMGILGYILGFIIVTLLGVGFKRLMSSKMDDDEMATSEITSEGWGVVGLIVIIVVVVQLVRALDAPRGVTYRVATPAGVRNASKIRQSAHESTTSIACRRIEPSLPVICETQTDSFELRGATVKLSLEEKTFWIQLQTESGDINIAECNDDPSLKECLYVKDTFNNFVENREVNRPDVAEKANIKIEDGRLTYEQKGYKTTPKSTRTPRPRRTVIVSEAAQETTLTTPLICQRIEPSLPLSCKTQTGNSDLWGARVQKPKGEKYFWVQIITDKDIINLAECNDDPTITECLRVSDAVNVFVEVPEEDASYVLGHSKLTIEDGRLTYEYEP
jgi:hypothetical protein